MSSKRKKVYNFKTCLLVENPKLTRIVKNTFLIGSRLWIFFFIWDLLRLWDDDLAKSLVLKVRFLFIQKFALSRDSLYKNSETALK